MKPWKPHNNADARINSAKAFLRVLLDHRPPEGLDAHLKELLDDMVWKITEAHGKLNTPFISAEALEGNQPVQHEHVNERRRLISDLIEKGSSAIDEVMADAIGCVVTVEEHSRLTKISREQPDLRGWDRYKAAGIKVIDRKG